MAEAAGRGPGVAVSPAGWPWKAGRGGAGRRGGRRRRGRRGRAALLLFRPGARRRPRDHCDRHRPVRYMGRRLGGRVLEVHATHGPTYSIRLSPEDLLVLMDAAADGGGKQASRISNHCPINPLSRKLSFNAARVRFFPTLTFAGSRFNRFTATCRTTPRGCGALPRRLRPASSRNVTSNRQCSSLSIPRCERTAWRNDPTSSSGVM